MYKYLEYKDDKSNKFWEVNLDGSSFTVRYGKIGTKGTEKKKSFEDDDKAEKEANKLIKQKEKKGYLEVSDSKEKLAEKKERFETHKKGTE